MKNKVKIMSAILVMLTLLASYLTAGGTKEKTPTGTSERKTIKLSHSHQADVQSSEIHFAAETFKKYVEENSKTLEVKIYAANALGEERAVYEGMQLGGGATAVISGTAILNNFNQKIGVLDLPFLWKDYSHVHKVLDGEVGNMLAKELESAGFKVLAWMDSWGYRNVVTAKKEVKKPEI